MTANDKLDDIEIAGRLHALDGWRLDGAAIRRDFEFPDFARAFAFMSSVAQVAEEMDHHPDWSNVYNRVTIRLNSHDVSGISERDFTLAERIDSALEVSKSTA